MDARYAIARYIPNQDRGEFINIGLVVEVDGEIGFQRTERFDLLAVNNADTCEVLKAAIAFFEDALHSGQIAMEDVLGQSGILTFSDIQSAVIDDVDAFMDREYERTVRPELRVEPKVESDPEPSPFANDAGFRYFVAAHGCHANRGTAKALACEGCQEEYLQIVDKIALSMDAGRFAEVREAALLRRAALAVQARRTTEE
jgi:hypothetical protein